MSDVDPQQVIVPVQHLRPLQTASTSYHGSSASGGQDISPKNNNAWRTWSCPMLNTAEVGRSRLCVSPYTQAGWGCGRSSAGVGVLGWKGADAMLNRWAIDRPESE
jgi:hypothetical protein